MQDVNRRRFLQLAGGSVAATMLSDSIARAATIPANRRTRSLEDVEHIVVLMQENRSFDHYYGVLRGVRGFGDPHPVVLPSGQPVWNQADAGVTTLPFRPDVGNLALTFIEDLDHSWDGTHEMFNGGNWDQWIPSKTTTSMAHMQRSDLPFHYALADAFTVCDGYHCSMLGPTDTNRYYMWTGWDGNDGKNGGPVIANDELGYGWQTYPSACRRPGSAGRSTRTQARVWTPRARGAGPPTIRTSATTATTRCCTSSTTRTRRRGARCTRRHARARTSAPLGASSTSSAPMSRAATCRRSRGSSPRRRTPSIRPGRRVTGPGTPPAS
jgi:hypothetical protein